MVVGGPAFVMWVSPTDEELFQKYSPELKKKSQQYVDAAEKLLKEMQ